MYACAFHFATPNLLCALVAGVCMHTLSQNFPLLRKRLNKNEHVRGVIRGVIVTADPAYANVTRSYEHVRGRSLPFDDFSQAYNYKQ